MSDTDKAFFQRASELIELANKQNQNTEVQTGEVSASFMYALARYNAWFGSTGFATKEQMQSKKQEMMDYYMERYKEMLEGSMDDYIENFDHYRATQN
ncbi:hypothetical protein TUM17387_29170 [Shewanella carassii]|uniref:DUF3144 domain-containing protein n=1 Tax=Shewanella carassii TaxID=1987584 RepID=UPI001BEEDFD9|nr:DUF3144 domain-containing protein [Shewanella carassii]BCV67558.1 hypothetical protein TUM17387_29170 [Shewanella carassii]